MPTHEWAKKGTQCRGTKDDTVIGSPKCTNIIPYDAGTDYCSACYRESNGAKLDPTHYEDFHA